MSKVKDPRYFLLNGVPAESDKYITGSRLPTCKQVLFCYLAHHATKTYRESANETVQSVIHFYQRARIPHLSKSKMVEAIFALHKKMTSLQKINIASREKDINATRINSFKYELNTTMKFWPNDTLEKISNEEDRLFLKSMMSDRKASMGPVDNILSKTEKKVQLRMEEEEKRKVKEQLRKQEPTAIASTSHESDEDISETYQHVIPRRSHKRVKKSGSAAFWPHDILKTPKVVQSALRNNISPTALSDLTLAFISATSGDPNKVSTSYSTAVR